ncbi:transposable element Tcb1 transposase [Trichonephila clavipes]|nr:transposable element Tcb1 transposase [Trichonephila clavipes]
MAVTDRSVTSRTVAQHIESVTHHSVSSCTIRRRLQQSGLFARRPLLDLPLTQNHRRLRRQWYDERRMLLFPIPLEQESLHQVHLTFPRNSLTHQFLLFIQLSQGKARQSRR